MQKTLRHSAELHLATLEQRGRACEQIPQQEVALAAPLRTSTMLPHVQRDMETDGTANADEKAIRELTSDGSACCLKMCDVALHRGCMRCGTNAARIEITSTMA